MDAPTISVITPTLGRTTLARTADSLLGQLGPRDEWQIIGDGPRPAAQALVERLDDERIHYAEVGDPESRYGNAQRNVAMQAAQQDLFVFLDDDDVLLDGAMDAVRRQGTARRPMMFRMEYGPRSCVLWGPPVLRLENVGGGMFVVPRVAGRWVFWRNSDAPVSCDFDFIERTLALWPPDSLLWCPEIIYRCFAHGEGR